MQSKESSDANSELFKEGDDEAMYKNPYEIRLCYLISVSLYHLFLKHAHGGVQNSCYRSIISNTDIFEMISIRRGLRWRQPLMSSCARERKKSWA